MPEPTSTQIRTAVKALGINVPIYRVEHITGGLRFYLYGRTEPVDYVPLDEIEITVEPVPGPKRKRRAKKATA